MDEKKLRERIISHGTTKDTDTGPQYVGCKCKRCHADRRKLAEIRMKKLVKKWNPGLSKLGLAL